MKKKSSMQEGELFRKYVNIRRNWYKFSRNKLSIVGLIGVCIIVFISVFANYLSPYPESAGRYVNFYESSQPPSLIHLCATDVNGRDILTRIFFGFRISLLMGVFVVLLQSPLGTILGLIAGYCRGSWVDMLIMRITDIFLAVPPLLLALVICSLLKPGLIGALLAVSMAWWPWYARMVYGLSSSIKGEFFVHAAEISGANTVHILFREILPNCLAPILTKMSMDMGTVILLIASLSFVGLGTQAPTPDLGKMVSDGCNYLPAQWWIAIFPALSIMFIVFSFNLLGDGIRDMLGSEERG